MKKGSKKKMIIIVVIIAILIAVIATIIIIKNNTSTTEELKGPGITPPDEEAEARLKEIMENGTKEEPESYSSLEEYSEDGIITDEEITSEGFEENAILATNGANLTLNNVQITRSAEDSDDETGAKMFGIGAAILAHNSIVIMQNTTVTTSGKGATGVFAYGTGRLSISDSDIVTYGDNAGGIHTASGGSISANNVNVTTYGDNSAAVRSEADGETMEINGGTYTTNGQDSPAIYSLAEVVVRDATMIANNSEVAFIDGDHSIRIENSDLTSNMKYIYERYHSGENALAWTVGIAQTMQKDDSVIGNFSMVGGTLTSNAGGIFYTSNTKANIVLNNVNITESETCDFFLRCTANGNNDEFEASRWGNLGENGATCNFTAIEQEMNGDVIWDSLSEVSFYMTSGSKLTGAVLDDETEVPDSVSDMSKQGYCNLYIDNTSTWVVTGNSTLSTLSNEGTIVDENGNQVTIKSKAGTTYVEGTSEYTITVDRYLETVDLNGSLSI